MSKKKLAIEGGRPSVPQGAFKSIPVVTKATRARVLEFLDHEDFGVKMPSDQLPSTKLSKAWTDYLGVKYCLPVNSGTAALHMCVAALDIGPGDEVIIPALTFWASAAAVLHHNAIPVFVDIEPETFCIDPKKIEAKISPRTKAIMPVHLHGTPADLDPIKVIAAKHNIKVIADACQAAGASYKGRKVGTMEDVTAFSMELSKPLSSGSEGGLFVTDNEEYFNKATLLRQFGELVIPGQVREYNAQGVGWNYRISQLGAAFALGQLESFEDVTENRIRCCQLLSQGLAGVKGVKTPVIPPDRRSVFFNYVLQFCPEEVGVDMSDSEFRVIMEKALLAEGIFCGKWQHGPVPAQDVFQKKNAYGKGCPWNCSHYSGTVSYDKNAFPETQKFLDSHTYVGPNAGKLVPTTPELVEMCLEGFHKIFENISVVIDATCKKK